MLQHRIPFVLALSLALHFAAPASAQTVKKRLATLPSGMVQVYLTPCSTRRSVDELCSDSHTMKSRIARFVTDLDETPTNKDDVTSLPYRVEKTGEIRWGAVYFDRRKNNRKQKMWLIEPRWAELHLLDADHALVRVPGTRTWQRLDTITGKTVPIGDGSAGPILSLSDDWGNPGPVNHVFLARTDEDGSATLILLTPEGLPTNVMINRVVPPNKMPRGRRSIEKLDDGTLLIHRLDAQGRVFDQIFNAEGTVAMTPPMPPLVLAQYSTFRRFLLLEIDRGRRLFWPVRGSDVLSKPPGIVGMRPAHGRFTAQLEPISPTEQQALYKATAGDPSPYAAEIPRCLVGTPGCDFSMVWAVAWEQPEGARLSLLGDSFAAGNYWHYDLARFAEISASAASAHYTLVRNVPERPETARSAMVAGGGTVTRIDTLLIAGRDDGGFDFIAHGGEQLTKKGELHFGLVNLALVPLSSESQAVAYTSSVMTNMRDHQREQWRQEQARIQEDASRLRQSRELQAARAQDAKESRFNTALASRDWQNAIQAAWQLSNAAVHRVTIAALNADGGYYVGYAELQLAETLATAAEKTLLSQHEVTLNAQAVRNQQRFVGSPSPGTSSPSTSTATPYVDTAASEMSNRIFNSRMDYIEGKTSSYQCGSASFCN